jgi:drug/metabolite transporter (DMT)-like permease
MNKKILGSDALLFTAAVIWGFAFTAQKQGMSSVGPFSYNAIRFVLGAAVLVPFIAWRRGRRVSRKPVPTPRSPLTAYFICGLLLFGGIGFQQVGMVYTSAGNCGFITGFYVVLVPIVGFFLGRKTGAPTWVGAGLAVCGLFCLSILSNISGAALEAAPLRAIGAVVTHLNKGDVLTFCGSLIWTLQILAIDRYSREVDPVELSAGSFVVCAILNFIAAFIDISGLTGATADAARLAALDPSTYQALGPEIGHAGFGWQAVMDGFWPIFYGGVFSSGVAYTLQAVAQKNAPPAHAVILLSFETVFAAVGGILLMGETLNPAKLVGFVLMFAGMLATQFDVIRST